MSKYSIVDFKGYIAWEKFDDGSYVVDPQYVNLFKETFPDAVEVVI